MQDQKTNTRTANVGIFDDLRQSISDYNKLFKTKLSLLVVFSAVVSFMIASEGTINVLGVLVLGLGGFLITAAANTLNQVLEREYDQQMIRTADRPLATGRMTVSKAVLIAGFLSLIGIILLAFFNPWTALLGTISLILYAFVYTPMKRVSPIAVMIGAVPGALPTAIGVVAFDGVISNLALALFAIQFFWQFPHFWAIAWVGDEDYKKAGFQLLPSKTGEKDENTGFQSFIYAILLIIVSWMPYYLEVTGILSAVVLTVIGVVYAFYSWKLYKDCTREAALRLMFCSFIYLPVALIALLVDVI